MNQPALSTRLHAFLREEDGQTTTEYVLILAVILTIIMQFKKKLFAVINVLFNNLETGMGKVNEDIMD